MSLFFVIDCESVGLFGESFAVGYVLCDRNANRLDEGIIATQVDYAFGLSENYQWIKENVKLDWNSIQTGVQAHRLKNLTEVREHFWQVWTLAKQKGAKMAADCLFPVEALFLADTVKQDTYQRQWNAPYPFIEISTLLIACGLDPVAAFDRLEDELPQHNPLMDARQSARIMIECFDKLGILKD